MKQSRFVILVKAIVYATGFGEWIGVQSFIICGECNFCVHDAISRPPQINCQVMIKYSVFLWCSSRLVHLFVFKLNLRKNIWFCNLFGWRDICLSWVIFKFKKKRIWKFNLLKREKRSVKRFFKNNNKEKKKKLTYDFKIECKVEN